MITAIEPGAITVPPYPTELDEFYIDWDFDKHCSVDKWAMIKLKDSIRYWLTPRKVSEEPPVFPCLMFFPEGNLEGFDMVDGWNVTRDGFFLVKKPTHWLPLPPAPEHIPDAEKKV